MVSVTLLPRSRPLTADDLETMPDDGPPLRAHRRDAACDSGACTTPSARRRRALPLAASGCPSYWVVDPDPPSITACELRSGRYVERARLDSNQVFSTETPFAVSFTPDALLG